MRNIFFSLAFTFAMEMYLLVLIGSFIGGLNAVLLMFAFMIVGIAIVKFSFKKFLLKTQHGEFDLRVFFIPLSGFLFLFPGLVTDVLALLLLFPFVQNLILKIYTRVSGSDSPIIRLYPDMGGASSNIFTDFAQKGGHRTIDGTATVVNEDSDKKSDDYKEVTSDHREDATSDNSGKNNSQEK